ncbi:MAG: Flp family type IVb pilin [Beijerinckiaceae bacterium]
MLKSFVYKFVQDQSGATAIEYGVFAALIALVLIPAVGLAGQAVRTPFALLVALFQPS